MLIVKEIGKRFIIADDEIDVTVPVNGKYYRSESFAELDIERIESDDTCWFCGEPANGIYERSVEFHYMKTEKRFNEWRGTTDSYEIKHIVKQNTYHLACQRCGTLARSKEEKRNLDRSVVIEY